MWAINQMVLKRTLTTVTGETMSPLAGVRPSAKKKQQQTVCEIKPGWNPAVCDVLDEGCRLFLCSLRWAVRRPLGVEKLAVAWAGRQSVDQ